MSLRQRDAQAGEIERSDGFHGALLSARLPLPEAQLPADHTGIPVRPVRVTHRPPLAVQVHLDASAARGGAAHQASSTLTHQQRETKTDVHASPRYKSFFFFLRKREQECVSMS